VGGLHGDALPLSSPGDNLNGQNDNNPEAEWGNAR
jgi:hypothetical protein